MMVINGATIAIIVGMCSIVAFLIGQYMGIKKKGYAEGKRDAKIDQLAVILDELVKEVKVWNMGALIQRIINLEKVVYKKSGDE